MGNLFDNILNKMNLNDPDDEYEYDYEYEDQEEEYHEPPKKSVVQKKSPEPAAPKSSSKRYDSKIVPMSSGNMEVIVIKPTSIDDSQEICDVLNLGRAVVINLEGIDVEVAQRIIDFVSGACYAINGNLQSISTYIFIVAPESIDISGDFKQELMTNGLLRSVMNREY